MTAWFGTSLNRHGRPFNFTSDAAVITKSAGSGAGVGRFLFCPASFWAFALTLGGAKGGFAGATAPGAGGDKHTSPARTARMRFMERSLRLMFMACETR